MIEFEVIGEAVGKARPRVCRSNGGVRAFTPQKTKDYERKVRRAYLEQVGPGPVSLEKALEVEILIFVEPPKNTSKKRRDLMLSGGVRPTKKPDVDNVVKAILDSLNGVAYSDDKQVVSVRAEKWYAKKPFVWVMMEKTDEQEEKLCDV